VAQRFKKQGSERREANHDSQAKKLETSLLVHERMGATSDLSKARATILQIKYS
jgi:hypothetical protein